jgi:hypothetical protein
MLTAGIEEEQARKAYEESVHEGVADSMNDDHAAEERYDENIS